MLWTFNNSRGIKIVVNWAGLTTDSYIYDLVSNADHFTVQVTAVPL